MNLIAELIIIENYVDIDILPHAAAQVGPGGFDGPGGPGGPAGPGIQGGPGGPNILSLYEFSQADPSSIRDTQFVEALVLGSQLAGARESFTGAYFKITLMSL